MFEGKMRGQVVFTSFVDVNRNSAETAVNISINYVLTNSSRRDVELGLLLEQHDSWCEELVSDLLPAFSL